MQTALLQTFDGVFGRMPPPLLLAACLIMIGILGVFNMPSDMSYRYRSST
jgi:hypothetical protein